MHSFGEAAAVAAGQHGRITLAQLHGSGITRAQVRALVEHEVLRRVHPRVYAVAGAPATWEANVMATLLSAGAHAVASHTSAAALWGFRNVEREAIEITTLRAERRRLPHVRSHRATELPKEDVGERNGIPVTSYERTLCDMTTQLFPTQLGRILDDGLREGVAGLAALQRCAERLGAGPNRRLAVIEDLLAARSGDHDPGGSASELRVLLVIRDAGLPEPVQQYRVETGGRTFFLDYAYPEQRVMIEYYGLAVHGNSSAVAHDSRRLSLLVCDGWRPLPFTDDTSDREIVAAVASVLGAPPRR